MKVQPVNSLLFYAKKRMHFLGRVIKQTTIYAIKIVGRATSIYIESIKEKKGREERIEWWIMKHTAIY